jgi:hypothetical protein
VAVVVVADAAADAAVVDAAVVDGVNGREDRSMTTIFATKLSRSACAVAIVMGLVEPLLSVASAQDQAEQNVAAPEIESLAADVNPPTFDTPEAALDAFSKALKVEGADAVAVVLGLDPVRLKADESTADALAAIKEGAAKQIALEGEGDRRLVVIGQKIWPFPFPLVKGEDGKWAFDTFDGLEEIVNRRVGENELQAIETMRAYVDAQEDYASQDRDDDGVNEFAQKLLSSTDTADGLYWPTDDVNGESPGGDLDQSELDAATKGEGYFGYKFKILTGQGDQIAGGAYEYVINANMIAGFGLIGWPAKYGETGVKTFVVNQLGIVYETDLGQATEAVVKYIDHFNPDESWQSVN